MEMLSLALCFFKRMQGTSVNSNVHIYKWHDIYSFYKRNYSLILTSEQLTDGSQSVHSPVSLPLQSFWFWN